MAEPRNRCETMVGLGGCFTGQVRIPACGGGQGCAHLNQHPQQRPATPCDRPRNPRHAARGILWDKTAVAGARSAYVAAGSSLALTVLSAPLDRCLPRPSTSSSSATSARHPRIHGQTPRGPGCLNILFIPRRRVFFRSSFHPVDPLATAKPLPSVPAAFFRGFGSSSMPLASFLAPLPFLRAFFERGLLWSMAADIEL